MKLLIAIINPYKLDDVRNSLLEAGIVGATVTSVKGYGRQKGHVELYRGTEYEVAFIAKTRIEIVVSDDMLDIAIHTISDSAKSGKIGDGKIFVVDQEETIRIRTGETGIDAI